VERPVITIEPENTGGGGPPSSTNILTGTSFVKPGIEIDACFYGITNDASKDVWEIASVDTFEIETLCGTLDVSRSSTKSETTFGALLVTSQPVIVNELFLIVDTVTNPLKIHALDLYVQMGCFCGGGGVVEKISFSSVNVNPSTVKYSLRSYDDSGDAMLPYYLEGNEALGIEFPFVVSDPGLYTFHLEAVIVDYNGQSEDIKSHSIMYGFAETSAHELSSITIHER
jgi:hypothetical protein